MKTKIASLYFFSLLALCCKAQIYPPGTIIPIEDYRTYRNSVSEIPDGIYIKDINNVLDKYVGTWIGTYNNKTYEFHVIEFTDNFLGITKDKLLMRYKITDANGNVIENTMNLPNDSPYVIKGRHFGSNGANYILTYIGQEAECGQDGHIYINTVNNDTQMNLFLWPDGDLINSSDCPNGSADQIFPIPGEGYIVLTKQ